MKADIILKKELLKGNDGGYYVPTVDNEYNLSWQGTRADMVTPESTNIKSVTLNAFLETDEYKSIVASEQSRATAEQQRSAAESKRANAERSRSDAETVRASAEDKRASAEQQRSTAENGRILAESQRANTFTASIADWEEEVNTVIDNCERAEETRSAAFVDAMTEWDTAVNNTIGTAQADINTAVSNAESATQAAHDAITALANNAHAGAIKVDCTADLVFVNDADDAPAEIKTIIKPKQTGMPAPDNICSISGWDKATLTRCRKNLLGFENYSFNSTSGLYTDTYDSQTGIYTRTIRNNHSTNVALRPDVINVIKNKTLPPDTYVFSINYLTAEKLKGDVWALITLADGTTLKMVNGVATTLEQFGDITEFKMSNNSYEPNEDKSSKVIKFTAQIEKGTVATTHEIYNGDTYTVDFNETVYGGSYDWTTGELADKWTAPIELTGYESWMKYEITGTGGLKDYFYLIVGSGGSVIDGKVVSSHFPTNLIASSTTNNGAYVVNSSTGTSRLIFRPDMTVFKTVENWTDYLKAQADNGTPVTVSYLQAGVNIQLEPQQIQTYYGTNTIYSDSGETNVNYIADTKTYIDNKFNELATALVAMGG